MPHFAPQATRVDTLVASLTPIRATKTDANITLAVSAVWADIDAGGAAAARPLDIVIPNSVVGQWVEYTPTLAVGTSTGGLLLNLATIVAGVATRMHDATFGFLPWSAPANASKDIVTPYRFQITSGMIENGAVRCRLQYQQATATRVINATTGIPLIVEGRGPFG